MSEQSFTTAFAVDQTPEEVFAAITDVRSWWPGRIDGSSDALGDEFTYSYKDVHRSTQKVTEFVPGERLVWLVSEAYLAFTDDKAEWKSTKITFDITRAGDRTEVRFTHVGLVPEFECFDACSNAWGFIINRSLPSLITTGKGLDLDSSSVNS